MSPVILSDLSALKRPLAHGGVSICLCMIVKDEANIIKRCLESVKPHISSWCIVDTGSHDGTQKRVQEALAGIPGQLHSRPWVNFAHNRNEALELAFQSGADYIMTIDADEVLVTPPIHGLTDDVYTINVQTLHDTGEREWLVKNGYKGRWTGAIHEYLQHEGIWVHIKDARFLSYSDGARAKDPQRHNLDLLAIFREINKDPKNPRNFYYLGATYLAAGDLEQAAEAFKIRLKMGGDPVELERAQKYLDRIHGRAA